MNISKLGILSLALIGVWLTGCSTVQQSQNTSKPIVKTVQLGAEQSRKPNSINVLLDELGVNYSSRDERILQELVDIQLDYMSVRHKSWTESRIDLGQKYYSTIQTALKQLNLPQELMHLPLVESGYNWNAASSAKAKGLWQFMAPTARQYGLSVNATRDDRLDAVLSTAAASRYLNRLRSHFNGDMLLALAAYNTGEGNLEKMLKKSDKKNFVGVYNALYPETKNYVPRFLATVLIARSPQHFGIAAPNRHFVVINLPAKTSIKSLAAASATPETIIRKLNRDLDEAKSTPNVDNFLVRLPADTSVSHALLERIEEDSSKQYKAPVYVQRTKPVAKSTPSNSKAPHPNGLYINYRVQAGNTLSHLSDWFGQSISNIKAWNPNLKNRTSLYVGEVIVIRGLPRDWYKAVYEVKRGDSLGKVSQYFGVNQKLIQKWNGKRGSSLREGENLVVYYRADKRKY